MRSYNPVVKGHRGQIKKAIQVLMEAKRPMVYTGGGVILGEAAPQLTRLVRLLGLPVHQHADGPRRLSRDRPPVPRHARHARHLRSEHGDAALRRAARDRRALRRPRDRQSEALLRRAAHDHPHRHRSVVDLQARESRRADRRQRRAKCSTSCCASSKHRRRVRTRKRSRPGGRRSSSGAAATASSTTARARSSSRST